MAEESAPKTFDKLGRQQLEIYASELRQHMESERRLNGELEERNGELEQRIREITALNQLFQQHLSESASVVQAYEDIHQGLKQLVKGTTILEEWTQSRAMADPAGLAGDGPQQRDAH